VGINRIVVVLAMLIVIAGCSATQRVDLTVRGVAPLNRNAKGEDNSVKVRVFPLRADARFRSATFESLWQLASAREVLGPDWVRVAANDDPPEFIVYPATADQPAVEVRLEIPKGVKHLGIVALYPRSDARDLRSLVLPIDDTGKAVLTFTGYAVSVRGGSMPEAARDPAPKPAASEPAGKPGAR